MLGTGNNSSHPMLSCTDGIAASGVGDFLLLVGRVLAGWIFLSAGWAKIMGLSGFVASQVATGVPTPLAYIAPFAECLGGLALIIGFATRYAALGLVLFTIIATYLAHRYWIYPAEQQAAQKGQSIKNAAIIGGLLAMFVAGPGRLAVDRFLRR